MIISVAKANPIAITVTEKQLTVCKVFNDVSLLRQLLSLLSSILTILLTCPSNDTLLCYGITTPFYSE